MRRRRKSGGTWFPILGNTWQSGDDEYKTASFSLATDPVPLTRALGPSFNGPIPVTKDYTLEPTDTSAASTLQDFVQGQDWLLQRLVGKLHIGAKTSAEAGSSASAAWKYIEVAAGFFVGRAQDDDQNFADLFIDECDVNASNNIQNPWIWRRTWILRNPANTFAASTATSFFEGDFPIANAAYGSIIDGPHIDSRVKRRIRREERLWFIMQTNGWDGERSSVTGAAGAVQPFAQAHLDLRIFGSLRKGKNSSAF